eukprot:SAG11_NODE_2204_length_3694_cov_11.683171_3_plen_30_part_00
MAGHAVIAVYGASGGPNAMFIGSGDPGLV